MAIQKLLQLTIVDALDGVWSKSGVIPSKKTRETILKAAEMISKDVCEDFLKVGKKRLLNSEKWEQVVATGNVRKRPMVDSVEVHHDEIESTVTLLNV